MKPETQLDYAVFQLTPTRTRCELHVAAQGKTYKLASGLLKPFVAHLRTAEEQLAKGGYSIRLEPPDPGSASWFTKGTMERFVRFVSTPEVLERVSTVEVELIELEETINLHSNDTNETNEPLLVDDQPSKAAPPALSTGTKPLTFGNQEKPAAPPSKTPRESAEGFESSVEENSKQRLLRALDARRLMLQKEQGMAFARAIAAGFLMEHMGDLVMFAECFGANRLREACLKFMALCKKRQDAGLWLEDLDLAAAEAAVHPEVGLMGVHSENAMGSFKSREYPDVWSDLHGGDMKLSDFHRAAHPTEGRLFAGEDGPDRKLTRHGSLEIQTGDFWQLLPNMRGANGSGMMGDFTGEYSPMGRMRNGPVPVGGRNQFSPDELHAATASHLSSLGGGVGYADDAMGTGEYRDGETGRAPSLVRGHPVMAAWQGQPPQNQYIPNVHNHSPQGALHPSFANHLELPYGFAGPGRGAPPGMAHPQYMGPPYMQTGYADNPWQVTEGGPNWMGQVQPPLQPQYWQGNQGYIDSRSLGWEPSEGSMNKNEQKEANSARNPSRERQSESTHVKPLPVGSGEGIAGKDGEENVLSSGKMSDDHSQKVADPSGPENLNYDELVDERDEDIPTRRYPRRSASPSRRSSSPMRKVQIGRSGHRRSGMVVIRNINYIAPNSQERSNKGDHNPESSSSWSEEGDSDGSDDGLKAAADSVKVSVQDVIGMFENPKGDSSVSRRKSERKEARKSPSGKVSKGTGSDDACWETKDEYKDDSKTHALVMDDAVANAWKPSNLENDNFIQEASSYPLKVRVRERATPLHSSEMLAEQQGPSAKKKPLADDSFIVSDHEGFRSVANGAHRATIDPDSELANNQTEDSEQQSVDKGLSMDDSIIVLNRAPIQEKNVGRSTPLDLESEMPVDHYFEAGVDEVVNSSNNFEPDDLIMMPERSKEAVSRSWTSPLDYDMQLLEGEVTDETHQGEEGNLENDLHILDSEKADKSKVINSKKVEREAKAKAMQEMLERRKAGFGKRLDRPNPLAEAQLRAEKLRAYKAGLQKSKKEKEEEERKRIEDLRNQRRERIAARSSMCSGGTQVASSTRGARSTASPQPSVKSSPTASQKLPASRLRESVNGSSSLSPSLTQAKVSSISRLSRPSKVSPSPKPVENPLIRSVSAISELRKDVHKTTSLTRASTGSQRLSQLKSAEERADKEGAGAKTGSLPEKEADKDASTIKANGHVEIKKRLLSTKKGSSPSKETKADGPSPVKPGKTQSMASKQQKLAVSTNAAAKTYFQKELTSRTEASRGPTKPVRLEAVKEAGVQASSHPSAMPLEMETEMGKQEAVKKPVESTEFCAGEENAGTEGHIRIRSPESSSPIDTAPHAAHLTIDASVETPQESKQHTSSLDASEGPLFPINAHAEDQAFIEEVPADVPLQAVEAEDGSLTCNDYQAPIAHISSFDNEYARYTELDANENNGSSIFGPEHQAATGSPLSTEQVNSPTGLLNNEAPIDAMARNLSQLQEAMHHAQSPEAIPVKTETVRTRKKWGDSGPQKTSKEHAKGFKRLLRLGRKSSRTSAQNSSEWISASTTSDNDEDGDDVRDLPTMNGKNPGVVSSVESVNISEQVGSFVPLHQQLKSHDENNSATKASRSFFSLSTFRSKSTEIKARS